MQTWPCPPSALRNMPPSSWLQWHPPHCQCFFCHLQCWVLVLLTTTLPLQTALHMCDLLFTLQHLHTAHVLCPRPWPHPCHRDTVMVLNLKCYDAIEVKISTLWPSTNWLYRQPLSYWPWVVFNGRIIHLIAPTSLVTVLSLSINLSMWIEFQDFVFCMCWNGAKREEREKSFPFLPFIAYWKDLSERDECIKSIAIMHSLMCDSQRSVVAFKRSTT